MRCIDRDGHAHEDIRLPEIRRELFGVLEWVRDVPTALYELDGARYLLELLVGIGLALREELDGDSIQVVKAVPAPSSWRYREHACK